MWLDISKFLVYTITIFFLIRTAVVLRYKSASGEVHLLEMLLPAAFTVASIAFIWGL